MRITNTLAALLTLLSLVFCPGGTASGGNADAADPSTTLATVNGVPITGYDLQQSSRKAPHAEKLAQENARNAVETLVRDELVYQLAVGLGLDKHPAYREKLQAAEAQLRAFKREAMSGLYREHVRERAAVTQSEALDYFKQNADRIRTKFHVWQILHKGDPSKILQDEKDLRNGTPFEEVASRRFSKLGDKTKAPWDLGYLRWNQLPEKWHGVVERMAPGQVSGVIKGDGGRFWIIKLIDKAVDPETDFASEKDKIIAVLIQQKTTQLYDHDLKQMRSKSKVVFSE